MNRKLTNAIRFVMDECIPPIIRDSRWFMYPFFYVWYKGNNIKKHMDFKSLVFDMSEEEFAAFYDERTSLATDRPTDLNEPSIQYMLKNIPEGTKRVLDVGCGNGYFLKKVKEAHPNIEIHGCDIKNDLDVEGGVYHKGNVEHLPFEDNSFDVVTCHHTLEHVINLQPSIDELKRVAKNAIFIVVPKQRYFYYTLDEHVRFFPFEGSLTSVMGCENYTCQNVWGDWVYIGKFD